MSEEMINLESHDTLGIKMENPIQQKVQRLPQPQFFMDPKKALPFWLVRSLQDKMPMVSIPEKIKVPYTRGLVGESLVQSLDPNKFVMVDPMESPVEYAPLHDKNLKKFFESPKTRKIVEETGQLVDGRTACTLKEYNAYRLFIYKMLLNHVTQEEQEEEKLRVNEMDIQNFLRTARKFGKETWNKRFKEYLRQKNQDALHQSNDAKQKKCRERLLRGEKALERKTQMQQKDHELRKAKWVAYKKRMDNYFKAVKDDQRRRGIYARKRWVMEAVINQHRKSLNLAQSKFKREMAMEKNWNARMAGQKLKLKKDKVVREQYHACIQLMKSRREKYYNCRDVEIDELLALPGMNSLDELEVFNTQFDQFSPEFVKALHGARFYINRSAKSLSLDKSLRKFIQHHESATERMKKANVARPIKHALDLLIRRSVGYYAMVVTYKTIKEATPMALSLAEKIRSSSKLRELLLEEYKQFGPRSDTPFQTAKKFEEDGLSHCMCDYTLIDKDTLEWPCPLCRANKESSLESEESSESTCSQTGRDEVYIIGEGTATVGFLVPPRITEGTPEMVFADTAVEFEPLIVEGGLESTTITRKDDKTSEITAQVNQEPELQVKPRTMGSKTSNRSRGSMKSKELSNKKSEKSGERGSKTSKDSRTSRRSTGNKKSTRTPKLLNDNQKPGSEEKPVSQPIVAKTDVATVPAANEGAESLPIPPISEPDGGKLKRPGSKKTAAKGSKSKRASKRGAKDAPKKSILKHRSTKSPKQTRAKGVSFAETAEFQKAGKWNPHQRYSGIETNMLLQASASQYESGNKPKIQGENINDVSNSSISQNDVAEFGSKSSIVSLLSITSDDRLHFVKGQCVRTKRGSKFGKLPGELVYLTAGKKGFVKGTCKCFKDNDTPSCTSQASDITKRLSTTVSPSKKLKQHARWRGVEVDKCKEGKERDVEEPKDIETLLSSLPPKKAKKLRYLVEATNLKVVCHCKKCFPGEKPENQIRSEPEQPPEAIEACRCRRMKVDKKQDRLAYITKVIGTNKVPRDSNTSDTKSVKSRKMSAKSVLERHKSIISRLFRKKSPVTTKGEPITTREPDVQKYYVDEAGNLHVLNRRGVRTHLANISKDFKIDERGRKYFIDDTKKKYLIDVTGRVYLENDNGDVLSLFHEEGKEYPDPEPKKLLIHDMVRKSVVDLLDESPQEELLGDEDLVEMVYEYLHGASDGSEITDRVSERSDDIEVTWPGKVKMATNKGVVEENVGPRMPIKRPLNSLINEVPFNRDISKLFIQRKKFHDCTAIVFRRTLLYSLASYTKIVERGRDPSLDIVGAKKILGLEGMVKGLTKITAHYPLKLIKSKRLAPYVDAVVNGFLGTGGYRIFPGQAAVFRALSTPESSKSETKGSSVSVLHDNNHPERIHLVDVEGVDEMKQICLCGKENAASFVDKTGLSLPIEELMKIAICRNDKK